MKKKITAKEWLRRFYRVPANEVVKADALKHSIRKWTGLVKFGNPAELVINSGSCALCEHYATESGCNRCPLYESRHQTRCDIATKSEVKSPYTYWEDDENAKPMLNALKRAAKYEKVAGKEQG